MGKSDNYPLDAAAGTAGGGINNMTEIRLNGLVFVFNDDTALIEWLDAHADEMYEEGKPWNKN